MNSFQEFSENRQRRSFSEIITHAFETYKGIFLYALLAMVLYTLVSIAVEPASGFDSDGFSKEIIDADGDFSQMDIWAFPGFKFYYGLSGIVTLLLAPLFVGIIYMANKYNFKQPLHVGDLLIGYKQNFVNILIYSLLSSVIITFSFLLCFLPVFFVLPLLLLGYPILLFENASFTEAFQKSFKIAKDNYGTFLLTSFVGLLISFAGIFLCIIGIFATLPFYMVVMYSAYCAYCGSPRPVNPEA